MAYIPWWQRMSPPTFTERFDLGGLAGRVGFKDGPPGTIKKATGPTKLNVGDTSPVYNAETGHIHKRTNRWGTVYSNVDDTAAKKKGWEKRIRKPNTVKGLEEIRAELVENGKRVTQRNGKFIFADITEQAAFDTEIDKRYSSAKTSTSGKQSRVLNNAEIYERFLKGHYSEKGIHDLIFRHKKANDLEYVKLSNEEKQAHKVEREKLFNKYQVKRISGTKTHPAHHIYSLGDEFDVRTKDIVIIPEKINARLQASNRKMLAIAKERVNLLSDVNIFNAKNIKSKLQAIDARAARVINTHYKKFPEDKGLLKYRKINAIIAKDGSISFAKGNSIGGDSSKWIQKDMGKNIKNLDKNELKVYREYLLNKAKELDLKAADESKSSRTKPQIFARKILDKGQGVWKMLPGKNFRVMPSGALAATDFAIMSLMGMSFPAAMASASGWLGKADVGKAAGLTASNISFMDEMNQKKAEDNLAASKRLTDIQSTAQTIEPFKLEEDDADGVEDENEKLLEEEKAADEKLDKEIKEIKAKELQKETIRRKYEGVVDDDLLDNMLEDDDPQRLAEVIATIEEQLIMQKKGMSPGDIIEATKESWERKKQATGGLTGVDQYIINRGI